MVDLIRRTSFGIFVLMAFLIPGNVSARDDTRFYSTIEIISPNFVLPRMSNQPIVLKTVNVAAIDVSIYHVGESNTLNILSSLDSEPPPEAQQIWHDTIKVDAKLNEEKTIPLDVLRVIGPLQTGLYVLTARDTVNSDFPAKRQKWFAVSNLGVDAFVGAGGITAAVHLLSEPNVTPNVELALLAENNRELTRIHTDNAGIAHFDAEVLSGRGGDAPAAIYAYGANGEFTPIDLQGLSLPSIKALPLQPLPKAWMTLERDTYRTNDLIKGIAVVRDEKGNAVLNSNLQFALVHHANGDTVVDQQNSSDTGDGSYSFTLHMPSSLDGNWTIEAYMNDETLASFPINQKADASLDSSNKSDSENKIAISPGRRSFQPGEMADIFVQPPFDADVTIVATDQAMRSAIRQHIGKDGGVVQIQIPGDVVAGLEIVASATAPDGVKKSLGTAWLPIDKSSKRLAVALDSGETAAANSSLPLHVTLSNLNGETGYVLVIATSEDTAPITDPLSFFLGEPALHAQFIDSSLAKAYNIDNSVPGLKQSFSSILWQGPVAVGQDGSIAIPLPMPDLKTKLRFNVIAWSNSRMGSASTTVSLTSGTKSNVISAAKPTLPQTIKTGQLAAGVALKTDKGATVLISQKPFIIAPETKSESDVAFLTSANPHIRNLLESITKTNDDEALIETAVLLQGLENNGYLDSNHDLDIELNELVFSKFSAKTADQEALFHYLSLKNNHENKFGFEAWLNTKPLVKSSLGHAALAAAFSQLGNRDNMIKEANTVKLEGDVKEKALSLFLLSETGQFPTALLDDFSKKISQPKNAPTDIALRLVAQKLAKQDASFKLTVNGKDLMVKNVSPIGTGKIINSNSTPLYFLSITPAKS